MIYSASLLSIISPFMGMYTAILDFKSMMYCLRVSISNSAFLSCVNRAIDVFCAFRYLFSNSLM